MPESTITDKLPPEQKEKWLYDLQTAVNDISVMAAQGGVEPFELDPPERCLYYALADLYRKHGVGELSTDDCKQAKQNAVRQYEKDRALLVSYQKQVLHHAKMWNRIEHACSVYSQSGKRTAEADAFVEAVYGCKLKPVGDNMTPAKQPSGDNMTPIQVALSDTEHTHNGYSDEPRRCGKCNCYLPMVHKCSMTDRPQKPTDICYYKRNAEQKGR